MFRYFEIDPKCSSYECINSIYLLVFLDATGVFEDCLDVVDPANFLYECRYDICADPSAEDTACTYFTKYVAACKAAGIDIPKWRDEIPNCRK